MSRWAPVACLLACLLWASSTFAADPPGRVGRLAEATGPVWVYGPSQEEWSAAPLNRPVTAGERLQTDRDARADVRIGSTSMRLDGGTEIEFERLDDDRIRVRVHEGSLGLRLRAGDLVREIEVLTAEGRVLPQRTGRYRVDRRDGATAVTVADGQALFEGTGAALTVYPRQRAEFWVDRRIAEATQYSISDPLRDAFTAWNNARDQAEDRLADNRYVSPEMTGAEDLDQHGRWEETPEYGPVWIPYAVPVGWAPYRFGHWTWISPWGWTWVDDARWGFAPFHYGRWVWYRSAWSWAPGFWTARPVFAPALVAWVGGPSVSVGVTIGGGPPVGWFPLAPREVYVPWYGVSPHYVRHVNQPHVRVIGNVDQIVRSPQTVVSRTPYLHRWLEPAVTVVPGSVVVGRQPVAPIAAQWRDAPGTRDLFRDPTRGGSVVADPGLPGRGVRPPGVGQPPLRRPEGLPPPLARERMGIPERMPGRAPEFGARPPVGSGDRPREPWSGSIPPGRPGVGAPGWPPDGPMRPAPPRPGGGVDALPPAARPGLMPVPGMPNTGPGDDAARRIGREPLPPVGRPPTPAPPLGSGPPVPGPSFSPGAPATRERLGLPPMPPSRPGLSPPPAPAPPAAMPAPAMPAGPRVESPRVPLPQRPPRLDDMPSAGPGSPAGPGAPAQGPGRRDSAR